MAPGLLDLPLEIRLEIYKLVFGEGKAVLEAGPDVDSGCMLPRNSAVQNHSNRSAQLLRVRSTVLLEARPVLYAQTIFHVLHQTFAGTLPTRITDGHPCAPYIRHWIIALDCDLLKRFDREQVRLDLGQGRAWSSLEIRCRVATWRNSFRGDLCDREAFLKGREQVIECGRVFHGAINAGRGLQLVEDRSGLGRGCVVVAVKRSRGNARNRSSECLVIIP